MDKLKDYLSINFKRAFKSVRFNYRQYLCFFAAVFVVQMFFWTLTFSTDTDKDNIRRVAEDNYEHHIIIRYMNGQQYTILNNEVYYSQFESQRAYDSVEFEVYNDMIGRTTYTAYVTLADIKSAGQAFEKDFIRPMRVNANEFDVTYTPLYDYEYGSGLTRESTTQYWLLMALMTVLSILLLMALYNIRINHYKFLYGVYMTCGADFRKLFNTAVWELLMISLMTFLPSMIVSILSMVFVYRSVGVAFHFVLSAVLKVALFNLIAVIFSVWLPMKWMAHKAPMSLIVAQDNSNLVTSPRRSFRILGRKMPLHYESFSTWRFRVYFVKLIATATAFSALFLCGLYIRQMVMTNLATPIEEFQLSAAEDIDDGTVEMIMAVDGVRYCWWENTMMASLNSDHILLTAAQGSSAAGYTVPSEENAAYPIATNQYQYTALDKPLLDMIVQNDLYEIEGDPYSVLTQKNTVLISDSIANTKMFDFKPGDKIILASFAYRNGKIDGKQLNAQELLRQQIMQFGFEYTEYTIGAVIHNSEAGAFLTFGIPNDTYETLADTKAIRQNVSVFVEPDATTEEMSEANEEIRSLMSFHSGYKVKQMGGHLERTLLYMQNLPTRVMILAVLILIICPLVWFFSQTLFYAKRRPEMDVLRSFGTTERELQGVHRVSGAYMAVISIFISLILAYSASGLVFLFCNRLMSSLGIGAGTRYEFYISVPALISCIVISMACGYLSSTIPFLFYRARLRREQRTGVIERTDIQ
ncbi:MAG: hypothetical protein IJW99_00905 [Clostridia bacterium]|nr:hypothetical protein [Clostridia bacterium]